MLNAHYCISFKTSVIRPILAQDCQLNSKRASMIESAQSLKWHYQEAGPSCSRKQWKLVFGRPWMLVAVAERPPRLRMACSQWAHGTDNCPGVYSRL
jgi:hypothetical protein